LVLRAHEGFSRQPTAWWPRHRSRSLFWRWSCRFHAQSDASWPANHAKEAAGSFAVSLGNKGIRATKKETKTQNNKGIRARKKVSLLACVRALPTPRQHTKRTQRASLRHAALPA